MQLADFLDCDAIKTALPGGQQALAAEAARRSRRRSGWSSSSAAVLASAQRARAARLDRLWPRRCHPARQDRGLASIYGLFARLAEPVDYKAIDGRPVDLIFLLLSPPDAGAEHLKALAAISRVTRDAATLERLRGARSRDALAAVLIGADERDAA